MGVIIKNGVVYGGGGASYTAGNGVTISEDNVISVDDIKAGDGIPRVADLGSYDPEDGEIVMYTGESNSDNTNGSFYRYEKGNLVEVPAGTKWIKFDNYSLPNGSVINGTYYQEKSYEDITQDEYYIAGIKTLFSKSGDTVQSIDKSQSSTCRVVVGSNSYHSNGTSVGRIQENSYIVIDGEYYYVDKSRKFAQYSSYAKTLTDNSAYSNCVYIDEIDKYVYLDDFKSIANTTSSRGCFKNYIDGSSIYVDWGRSGSGYESNWNNTAYDGYSSLYSLFIVDEKYIPCRVDVSGYNRGTLDSSILVGHDSQWELHYTQPTSNGVLRVENLKEYSATNNEVVLYTGPSYTDESGTYINNRFYRFIEGKYKLPEFTPIAFIKNNINLTDKYGNQLPSEKYYFVTADKNSDYLYFTNNNDNWIAILLKDERESVVNRVKSSYSTYAVKYRRCGKSYTDVSEVEHDILDKTIITVRRSTDYGEVICGNREDKWVDYIEVNDYVLTDLPNPEETAAKYKIGDIVAKSSGSDSGLYKYGFKEVTINSVVTNGNYIELSEDINGIPAGRYYQVKNLPYSGGQFTLNSYTFDRYTYTFVEASSGNETNIPYIAWPYALNTGDKVIVNNTEYTVADFIDNNNRIYLTTGDYIKVDGDGFSGGIATSMLAVSEDGVAILYPAGHAPGYGPTLTLQSKYSPLLKFRVAEYNQIPHQVYLPYDESKTSTGMDWDKYNYTIEAEIKLTDYNQLGWYKINSDNSDIKVAAGDIDLSNYALKSEIPSVEGLLTADDLTDYALKSEIPSVDGLLTADDLTDYALKSDIVTYTPGSNISINNGVISCTYTGSGNDNSIVISNDLDSFIPKTDVVVLYVGETNSKFTNGGIYQFKNSHWELLSPVSVPAGLDEFMTKVNSFLENTDATDSTINKWKEIESFLTGVTDTQTLTGLLESFKTEIEGIIDQKISDNNASNDETEETAVESLKVISDFSSADVPVGTISIYSGATNSQYTHGFIYEKVNEKDEGEIVEGRIPTTIQYKGNTYELITPVSGGTFSGNKAYKYSLNGASYPSYYFGLLDNGAVYCYIGSSWQTIDGSNFSFGPDYGFKPAWEQLKVMSVIG